MIREHRNLKHEIPCRFHVRVSSSLQRGQRRTLSTRLRSSDILLQRLHMPTSIWSSRLISMRSVRSAFCSFETVRRSRTVTIPMTLPLLSTTGSLLTLCLTIIWAASTTVLSALTVMSGVLMIALTWTVLGLRSFATTLQLMSSSVTMPIGSFLRRIITLPTSSLHMAFAAFATLASMPIMIGLRFITSLNGTRVSNRIVLVVFFMSHLLKSAWLMITISILSAPSINSMWQWHPPMRPGNRNTVPEGHVRRLQTCVTRNIIKNPCQTLLQAVDDRPGYRPAVQTKRGPYDDIFQDIGERKEAIIHISQAVFQEEADADRDLRAAKRRYNDPGKPDRPGLDRRGGRA